MKRFLFALYLKHETVFFALSMLLIILVGAATREPKAIAAVGILAIAFFFADVDRKFFSWLLKQSFGRQRFQVYTEVPEYWPEKPLNVVYLVGTPEAFLKAALDPHRLLSEKFTGSTIVHSSGIMIAALRPARHHHCLWALGYLFGADGTFHNHNQGFLTSWGRHVDRVEGALIARATKVLIREPTPADNLTSEDLWNYSS